MGLELENKLNAPFQVAVPVIVRSTVLSMLMKMDPEKSLNILMYSALVSNKICYLRLYISFTPGISVQNQYRSIYDDRLKYEWN